MFWFLLESVYMYSMCSLLKTPNHTYTVHVVSSSSRLKRLTKIIYFVAVWKSFIYMYLDVHTFLFYVKIIVNSYLVRLPDNAQVVLWLGAVSSEGSVSVTAHPPWLEGVAQGRGRGVVSAARRIREAPQPRPLRVPQQRSVCESWSY